MLATRSESDPPVMRTSRESQQSSEASASAREPARSRCSRLLVSEGSAARLFAVHVLAMAFTQVDVAMEEAEHGAARAPHVAPEPATMLVMLEPAMSVAAAMKCTVVMGQPISGAAAPHVLRYDGPLIYVGTGVLAGGVMGGGVMNVGMTSMGLMGVGVSGMGMTSMGMMATARAAEPVLSALRGAGGHGAGGRGERARRSAWTAG